jgi:hypothetical protein
MSKLSMGALAIMVGIILLMVVLGNFSPELYRDFAVEDGPVEYITFFGLLGVSFLLFYRFLSFRQNQTLFWKAVTLGAALLFIFGAGEEISWGQRLMGWETSEAMAALNSQNETNLHNIKINGVKLNKIIFTNGLGLGLGIYFIILPLIASKKPKFMLTLAKAGIPVPRWAITLTFLAAVLLVLLIPQSNKWETLEVAVPLVALAVLFDAYPSKKAGDTTEAEFHRAGMLPV